jgi:hypothetical protein
MLWFVIIQGGVVQNNEAVDMLDSPEGQNASDIAAYRLARENGYSVSDAVKYFVGSPELKLAILLESVLKQEFV